MNQLKSASAEVYSTRSFTALLIVPVSIMAALSLFPAATHGVVFGLIALLVLLSVAALFNLLRQLLDMKLNNLPISPGLVLMVATGIAWHAAARTFPSLAGWIVPGCAGMLIVGAIYTLFAVAMALTTKPVVMPNQDLLLVWEEQYATAPAGAADQTQLPTQNFQFRAARPSVNFDSIVGQETLKSDMRRALSAWQEKSGNGVLLFGPPGGGKSLMASALAGQAALGLIKVSYGDLASKWVGATTENLRKVFEDAWAHAPVVLFFDEADSLVSQRSGSGSYEEYNRMVTTFLSLVDDTRTHHPGVLLVAATNFKDRLDEAAVRAARFDFPVEVPLPDAQARAHLIDIELKKERIGIDNGVLERLVRRWGGLNVPTIQKATQRAIEIARAGNASEVNFSDLLKAMRTLQGYKGGAAEGTKEIGQLFYAPEVKRRLENLAAQMRDLDRFEELGGTLPKGVLFSGPPGTGKTAAASALAKACQWPLLVYSGKQLMSEDAVQKLRDKASNMRPAIVFIDEADDILADRSMSATKEATNALLQLIDGAGGMLQDVVWIAATNNPDMIDAAAVRGGRFGTRVEIGLPDGDVVRDVVAWWASEHAGFLGEGDPVSWVDQAAGVLTGLSQASILEALKDAKNMAVMDAMGGQNTGKKAVVLLEHVQAARAAMAAA